MFKATTIAQAIKYFKDNKITSGEILSNGDIILKHSDNVKGCSISWYTRFIKATRVYTYEKIDDKLKEDSRNYFTISAPLFYIAALLVSKQKAVNHLNVISNLNLSYSHRKQLKEDVIEVAEAHEYGTVRIELMLEGTVIDSYVIAGLDSQLRDELQIRLEWDNDKIRFDKADFILTESIFDEKTTHSDQHDFYAGFTIFDTYCFK